MHPEIVQDAPGSCPICGMALEPRAIGLAQAEENPEYDYMRRRFLVAAILTVPLVLIAMREMLPGGSLLENMASPRILGWLELALATQCPGRAVSGTVASTKVLLGNLKLLAGFGIETALLAEQAEAMRQEGRQ